MTLAIDHRSPLPLRAQVEQLLRKLLREERYQAGALLPDEVTLAARLGVSRGTVRAGISKLVFEGLLERKAGVGTRVAPAPRESGISAWRSFTREMAGKGIKVENYLVEYREVKASEAAARALRLEPGTPVHRLERVRGWEGSPVMHVSSWFHPRLRLTGQEQFDRPLYEVLEAACGVAAHHAHEAFVAVHGGARMTRLLQVSRSAPLLVRQHTVFDSGNRPFEFAEIHYASERFTLTLDLRRDAS